MRIHVVAVGRLKAGPERELCARYAERFAAAARPLGLVGPLIRECAEAAARGAAERRAREAAAIAAHLPDWAEAIRIDERGDQIDSQAFAALIAGRRDQGLRDLAFLIGGADGLGEALVEHAPRAVSFGRMTIPHQLARVLLLEQLYRAATLLAGHPYHRE